MSTKPLSPEFLHTDELQYQLQTCDIPVTDLGVAELPSAFGSSRDTEVNLPLLNNTDILLDSFKYIVLCSVKFKVLSDLIENTNTSFITADFPQFTHRLRQWFSNWVPRNPTVPPRGVRGSARRKCVTRSSLCS
jgi:hypothetical protein